MASSARMRHLLDEQPVVLAQEPERGQLIHELNLHRVTDRDRVFVLVGAPKLAALDLLDRREHVPRHVLKRQEIAVSS